MICCLPRRIVSFSWASAIHGACVGPGGTAPPAPGVSPPADGGTPSPQVEGCPTSPRSPLPPLRSAHTGSLRALLASPSNTSGPLGYVLRSTTGLISGEPIHKSAAEPTISIWLLHPRASFTTSRKASFFSGVGPRCCCQQLQPGQVWDAPHQDPANLSEQQKS